MEEQINELGKIASSVSAIIALLALVLVYKCGQEKSNNLYY